MKKILAAVCLSMAAITAQAEISGNASLVTDYQDTLPVVAVPACAIYACCCLAPGPPRFAVTLRRRRRCC